MPSDKTLHLPPGDSAQVFFHAYCTGVILCWQELRQIPDAGELNRKATYDACRDIRH